MQSITLGFELAMFLDGFLVQCDLAESDDQQQKPVVECVDDPPAFIEGKLGLRQTATLAKQRTTELRFP